MCSIWCIPIDFLFCELDYFEFKQNSMYVLHLAEIYIIFVLLTVKQYQFIISFNTYKLYTTLYLINCHTKNRYIITKIVYDAEKMNFLVLWHASLKDV